MLSERRHTTARAYRMSLVGLRSVTSLNLAHKAVFSEGAFSVMRLLSMVRAVVARELGFGDEVGSAKLAGEFAFSVLRLVVAHEIIFSAESACAYIAGEGLEPLVLSMNRAVAREMLFSVEFASAYIAGEALKRLVSSVDCN